MQIFSTLMMASFSGTFNGGAKSSTLISTDRQHCSQQKRRRSERGASERLRYEEEVIKIMNCGGGGGEAQDGDFRTFTISTSLTLS